MPAWLLPRVRLLVRAGAMLAHPDGLAGAAAAGMRAESLLAFPTAQLQVSLDFRADLCYKEHTA